MIFTDIINISNIIVYFLSSLFLLLVFLPGIALMYLLSKKFNLLLSSSDIIILGSVLWNFILVIPSLLLGLSSFGVLWYFYLFTVVSTVIIVTFVLFLIRDQVRLSLRIRINVHSFPIWVHILLIWFFVILLTFYSPILYNWDAIIAYLPMAKAIILTNGLTYNPYMLSKIGMSFPPLLPIIYAWVILFTNGFYLRFLPITYFLLINLLVFQLSSRILGRDNLISVMTFSSMLCIQMLVALCGLYLDLAFVFYTTASIYITAQMLAEKSCKILWHLFLGISCVLNALTNEIGVIISFLIFSLYMLGLIRNMIGKLIFALVTCVPHILQLLIKLYLGYPPLDILATFLAILVLFSVLLYMSTLIKNNIVISWGENQKGLFLFITTHVPAALFYLRNIFFLGVFSARHPLLLISTFYSLGYIPSTTGSITLISYFKWYNLFIAAGLGAPYMIPAIVGYVFLMYRCSKGDHVSFIVLSWLITILLSWSIFFRCGYEVTEFRRLTYFAPVFSILTSVGASALYRSLKLSKCAPILFTISNTLILSYVWIYRWSLNLFFAYRIFDAHVFDLIFFSLMFFTPIFILYMLRLTTTKIRRRFSTKMSKFFFLPVLLICCFSPIYMINLSLLEISKQTWDPNYYNSVETLWPWRDLINYYNNYIHDDYITVGFWAHPIMIFANRSYVDPSNYWGFMFLIPFLLCNETDKLLNMLYSQNVRYFILPKPNIPPGGIGALHRYKVLTEKYLLFKMITQDRHFVLLKEFEYFYLYKLT